MNRRGLRPGKPKLRKREIVLAVGLGLVAATGAGAVIEGMHEDSTPVEVSAPAANGGTEADRTYELAPFDNIATFGPQDVIVTYGDSFSVRAEGPAEALAKLEVASNNGTLTIKPQGSFGFNFDRMEGATFHVTMPALSGVVLTGSGDMTVDKVEGKKFSGTIAGSGDLQVGAMNVDEADLTVGGSGTLSAIGSARKAKLTIGGSGEIDAADLKSEDASVTIIGSGDAGLFVANQAKISIMGSGDVAIDGTDKCSVSRMGSGDVTCNGEQIADQPGD